MSAIRATQPPPGPPPSGSVSLAYLGGADNGDAWFLDLQSMRADEYVWILTGYQADRNVNGQSWSGHWTQVGLDCNTRAATAKGVAGVTSAGETRAVGNRVDIATVETISAGEDIFDIICLARVPDAQRATSAGQAIAAHRELIR
jgi:hypothetical protein